MSNSLLINVGIKWYMDNLKRLIEKSNSKIDVHYPDEEDSSFNLGFETKKTGLQIILYQEGYVDFYNYDIKNDMLTTRNVLFNDEKEMFEEFEEFFFHSENENI